MKRFPFAICAVFALLVAAAPALAEEISNEKLVQYLVENSPFEGEWHTIYGPCRCAGTYELEFTMGPDGLRAAVKNTKYTAAPPPPYDKPWDGDAKNLKVKGGKVSFRTPDDADLGVKYQKDGTFKGESQMSPVTNIHTWRPRKK